MFLLLCLGGFSLKGMEKAKKIAAQQPTEEAVQNYYVAIQKCEKTQVETFLDSFPAYANKENEQGETPLLQAVYNGFYPEQFEKYYEVFDCLIAKGADVGRLYKNGDEQESIIDIILNIVDLKSAQKNLAAQVKRLFHDAADKWIARIGQSFSPEDHEKFDLYVATKKIERKKKKEFLKRHGDRGLAVVKNMWETRSGMVRQALKAVDSKNTGIFIAEFERIQENVDQELSESMDYYSKWSEEKTAALDAKIKELEDPRKEQFLKEHSLLEWLRFNRLFEIRFLKSCRIQKIFDVEKAVKVYTATARELDKEYAQKGDALIKDIELTEDELRAIPADQDTKTRNIEVLTTLQQQITQAIGYAQRSGDLIKGIQHETAELKKDVHARDTALANTQINILKRLIEQAQQRVQEAEKAAEEARRELERLKREDEQL